MTDMAYMTAMPDLTDCQVCQVSVMSVITTISTHLSRIQATVDGQGRQIATMAATVADAAMGIARLNTLITATADSRTAMTSPIAAP